MKLEQEIDAAHSAIRAVTSEMGNGAPYEIKGQLYHYSRLLGKKLDELRHERELEYKTNDPD